MQPTPAEPQTVEGQQGIEVNYIGPDGAWYQKLYTEKYGEDFVSTFNGYLYDATELSALAIEQAGGTNPAAIRKALLKVDDQYDRPATGEIRFDADQQRAEQPYIFVEVQDGKVQEVSG